VTARFLGRVRFTYIKIDRNATMKAISRITLAAAFVLGVAIGARA